MLLPDIEPLHVCADRLFFFYLLTSQNQNAQLHKFNSFFSLKLKSIVVNPRYFLACPPPSCFLSSELQQQTLSSVQPFKLCWQISKSFIKINFTRDGLFPSAVSSENKFMCVCAGDLRERSVFKSLSVFSSQYFCGFCLNLSGLEFRFSPEFLFVLSHISLILLLTDRFQPCWSWWRYCWCKPNWLKSYYSPDFPQCRLVWF